MTEHELLVATKNTLVERGWMQPTDGSDTSMWGAGPTCVGVAMGTVCQGAGQDVIRRACALVTSHGGYIVAWNDKLGRTEEDVHAALDRAIAATAPQPDLSFLKGVHVEPEIAAA